MFSYVDREARIPPSRHLLSLQNGQRAEQDHDRPPQSVADRRQGKNESADKRVLEESEGEEANGTFTSTPRCGARRPSQKGRYHQFDETGACRSTALSAVRQLSAALPSLNRRRLAGS